GTEGRRLRTQRGAGGVELRQHGAGRRVVEEVGTGSERSQAETGRVEGHAVDRRGRLAGFVEHQLQRIAVQQVDAVEGRVLRRGGDLRDDLVVLNDQRCTRRLRNRIGGRRDSTAERRTTRSRAHGNRTDRGRR